MLRAAPCFNFCVDGARYFITWQQLRWAAIVVLIFIPTISFSFIISVLIFEDFWDVVEHKALTLVIGENSTITTD